MIHKSVLGLVVICALIACSDKPKKTEQGETEATDTEPFKNVYDTLDQLKIPITFRPDDWDDLYMKHLEKYGIKEGWELLKHPYAKLVDSKNYKAIIFISTDETGSPTLITIDRIGNPIDTLFLLGDSGGNDPSSGTSEIATINKDLTIHLLDSIFTYDLEPDGHRVDSTQQVTVSDKKYRILESGKIEKIE